MRYACTIKCTLHRVPKTSVSRIYEVWEGKNLFVKKHKTILQSASILMRILLLWSYMVRDVLGYLSESESHSVVSNSLQPRGLYTVQGIL